MEKESPFKNKNALITGASGGIGSEFAHQLASKGANLVLVSRKETHLQDIAGDIREKLGSHISIEIIPQDLSLINAPQEIYNTLKSKNIHIDILINNAGFGHWGEFIEEPYQRTLDMNMVNVVAVSGLCHLFIPPMIEKGEGWIVNLSSTAAFQPVPYEANYAATKAYVMSLSLSLWQELKDKNIKVLTLCPGFTKTNFTKEANIPETVTKRFKFLPPHIVVKEALEALEKGEPLLVPKGHQDFVTQTMAKFIPLKTKLKITADMFRP